MNPRPQYAFTPDLSESASSRGEGPDGAAGGLATPGASPTQRRLDDAGGHGFQAVLAKYPRSAPSAFPASLLSCFLVFLLSCFLLTLPGCGTLLGGTGGRLTAHSLTEPEARLSTNFDHAIYRTDGNSGATIVLYRGPLDAPEQALIIRMFWQPRAGSTPINPAATNATLHYLVFTDSPGSSDTPGNPNTSQSPAPSEYVGVYGGAGFLFPHDKLGEPTLRANLWHANLRLSDATVGFEDVLGQAELAGRFTARRDPLAVQQALRHLSQAASQRLDYPRLVRGDRPIATGRR